MVKIHEKYCRLYHTVRTFAILIVCVIFTSLTHASVVLNELHYNPDGADDLTEFIELWNVGSTPVDLTGWYMSDGVDFHFPSGTILSAGHFCVIARYPSSFSTAHPGVSPVYGPFENATGLRNSGERVALSDDTGVVISEVTYTDDPPWPTSPDGNGPSLELWNPLLDTRNVSSWKASLISEGTPGATNSVFVNDLVSFYSQRSPQIPSPGDGVSLEAVFTLDAPTSVTAQVTAESSSFDITFTPASSHVWTSSIPGYAEGTWVDYTVTAYSSNGILYTDNNGAQTYRVRSAPLMPGEIIINEMMYHSSEETLASSFEFVELYNAGTRTVDLAGCVFEDMSLDRTPFFLAPDDFIVLADKPWIMTNVYGIVNGQYFLDIGLDNGGENISFLSPNGIVLDSVRYEDDAPWPELPDGFGPSLERINPYLEAAAPASWQASKDYGTPGMHNSVFSSARAWYIDGIETVPAPVLPGDSPTLLVRVHSSEPLTHLYIEYTTDMSSSVQLEMHDDGTHNDGTANDGLYGVSLPAMPDNTIVWYAFLLEWSSASERYPAETVSTNSSPNLTLRLSYQGLRTDVTPMPYWQTAVTTGDATSSRLYMYTDNEGELLIDDVSITYTGTEHVTNGDFTNDLSGWSLSGNHVDSEWTGAYGNNGPGCLHVIATGVGGSSANIVNQYTSPSLVEDGRDYTLSFAYRSMPLMTSDQWLYYRVGTSFPQTVCISEINYHTMHDGLGDFDFIELYNYGTEPVNLAEWTLENKDGIPFSFAYNTILQPGGYILACADPELCGEAYNIPEKCTGPLTFDPANGSDTLVLRAFDGTIIDTVSYRDDPPWPVRADGDGGTLERISIPGDGTSVTNWFCGPGAGTPGTGHQELMITSIRHSPAVPLPSDPVVITAYVTNTTPDTVVRLFYRTSDWSPWSSAVMTDAGNGKYTHSLGTYFNMTTIRFFCEASNSVVRSRFPVAGETQPALCEIDSNRDTFTLPVFRYLFTDDNWNTLYNRRYWDNTDLDATLIIGTQIFYNVGIHLHGNYSRSSRKAFNAYLNYGQKYNGRRKVAYVYNWEHDSRLALPTAQAAYDHIGMPVFDTQQITVKRRGNQLDLMHYIEPYDDSFLDSISVTGNMYKATQASLQQAMFTFSGYDDDIYYDCYELHGTRNEADDYDDLLRGLEALYVLPQAEFDAQITNYFDANNIGLERAMYHYLKLGDGWPQWGQNYVLMTDAHAPTKLIPQDIGAIGWGPWNFFPTVGGVRRLFRHPAVFNAFWHSFTNLYYDALDTATMNAIIYDHYIEAKNDVDFNNGNTYTFNSQRNSLQNLLASWRNSGGSTEPSGIVSWGVQWISTPNRCVLLGDTYVYNAHAWHPGSNPINYNIVSGPSWLSINPTTGVVTGTPPSTGTYSLEISANNGSETVNQSFSFVVQEPSQRMWLRFNENTGTTTEDASDYSNNGTFSNDVTWDENGRYGSCVYIGDSSVDYVNVPASSSLNIEGDFTFETWIRFTQKNKSKAKIFEKYEELGWEQGVSYSFDGGRMWYGPFDDGKAIQNGLNGHGYILNRYNPDASQRLMEPYVWHHVAVTHERFRNEVYVYIDGQRIGGMEWNGNLLGTSQLILGGPFDGWMDEAKLHSFAREAFNIGLSIEAVRFVEPDKYIELRYFDGGAHQSISLENYALYIEPSNTWIPLPNIELSAGEVTRLHADDVPEIANIPAEGRISLYPYEPNTMYPPNNFRAACTRILDFVAYGESEPNAAPTTTHPAVQAGLWKAGTYVPTASNTHGRIVLRVPGRNDGGKPAWKCDIRLLPPTLTRVSTPSPGIVQFSWSQPVLAEEYDVQWTTDPTFATYFSTNLTANTMTTLLEEDTWYWRARAFGNGETSIFAYTTPFDILGDTVLITLTDPPAAGRVTNALSLPVSFSIWPNETPVTTEVYRAGTYIGDSAGTYTFQSGTNSVWVTATLTNGAQGTSATNLYIIDQTSPVVTLTSPAEGVLTNSRATPFYWQATDAYGVSKGEISTDNGTSWSPHSSGEAVTLADGTHYWTARATDTAGNLSDAPTARSITIDATPPFVTTNTLILPTGGNAYEIGEALYIQWNTNHFSDAHPHPLPISLWLGTNGHKFFALTNNIAITNYTYTWNIPTTFIHSEECAIWLEAEDILGNMAFDTNDTTFAIIPEPSFLILCMLLAFAAINRTN